MPHSLAAATNSASSRRPSSPASPYRRRDEPARHVYARPYLQKIDDIPAA